MDGACVCGSEGASKQKVTSKLCYERKGLFVLEEGESLFGDRLRNVLSLL